ncbi:MAG: gas vesicle protein K [Methanocellales archaeon]|nr:gas vesicle protein K [Methanocellales archaeon]
MLMVVDIDEDNLKQGILGLVIALVEIIKDALEGQALRRIEGGSLTEEEVERLGEALMDLDEALESIKREHDLLDAVQEVREGLDNIADELVGKIINPERWEEAEGIS